MKGESLTVSPQCKFKLGHVVATPNLLARISPEEVLDALCRHSTGDWGEVDKEDMGANDRALVEGTRLLSVYRSKAGEKFWLITEADRSATTILMPEDY